MKPATNVVLGRSYTVSGVSTCSIDPVRHDRDAVGHRQGLLLIVRDVDEGDPDIALDPLQLHLESLAKLQVQRTERLVEQQDLGEVDERAGQSDALLLPTGELIGLAVDLRGEADPLELGLDPLGDLGLRDLLAAQPEGDVLAHAQVREQGVALEDRIGGATIGGEPGDVLAVDEHPARGGLLEAGDHAQRRGLAAAAGAEHGEEFAPRDVELHLPHGDEVAEVLADPVQPDGGLTRVGRRIHSLWSAVAAAPVQSQLLLLSSSSVSSAVLSIYRQEN